MRSLYRYTSELLRATRLIVLDRGAADTVRAGGDIPRGGRSGNGRDFVRCGTGGALPSRVSPRGRDAATDASGEEGWSVADSERRRLRGGGHGTLNLSFCTVVGIWDEFAFAAGRGSGGWLFFRRPSERIPPGLRLELTREGVDIGSGFGGRDMLESANFSAEALILGGSFDFDMKLDEAELVVDVLARGRTDSGKGLVWRAGTATFA